MWHLRKVASSCEHNLVQFLYICQKFIKFCFKIWKMVEKIKIDVDRLLCVSIMEKIARYILIELNFFWFSKPKIVYLHPFLSCLLLPKFWKQNFPCGNCQIFALLQVWLQLGKLLFGYNMANVLDVAWSQPGYLFNSCCGYSATYFGYACVFRSPPILNPGSLNYAKDIDDYVR